MTSQEITIQAGKHQLSARWRPVNSVSRKRPLIVAIHGGSFTSKYFDLPGFSFLDSAHAQGFPILALDRPCYGKSQLSPTETTFALNAEILSETIQNFWQSHGRDLPGLVLIGHSIGGAITLMIAALHQSWPLLGVAVSGIGIVCPSHILDAWDSLPDIPSISLPPDVKRQVMFGPATSYDVEARELCMSEELCASRCKNKRSCSLSTRTIRRPVGGESKDDIGHAGSTIVVSRGRCGHFPKYGPLHRFSSRRSGVAHATTGVRDRVCGSRDRTAGIMLTLSKATPVP
jgi:pimeloyl-ACP methyl ester carboxylesterase